ncbi:MFS transporter [Lysobacter yangpyeongensis]|uniref:MFS transporter n=1 Tax=Lysobacter yangpyeongensis TaxID=346182 RepID=A0ABW0SN33_9GAMM
MQILRPLAHGPIARLWLGQSLATIGEQLYRIAYAWLLAGMIGSGTGFALALECVAVLLVALAAGGFAARCSPRGSMIGADLARAALALLPIVATAGHRLSVPALLVPSVALVAMRPLFDPALQASLPCLARDRQILVGANALMDATARIGRLVGPSVAGVLAAVLPTVGLMGVTSACFVASALAVHSLDPRLAPTRADAGGTPWRALGQGWRAVRAQAGFWFFLCAGGVINGLWSVAMWLALPLALRQVPSHVAGRDGLALVSFVVAAYGAGNLLSNLVTGSRCVQRPVRWIFSGQAVIAIGFILLGALSGHVTSRPAFVALTAAAGLAGMGAPLSDIPMATLRQSLFARQDIASVFRLKMIFDWSGMLIANLLAPLALRYAGASTLIVACGTGIGLVPLIGVLAPRLRAASVAWSVSAPRPLPRSREAALPAVHALGHRPGPPSS